jgi:hypothetical protein
MKAPLSLELSVDNACPLYEEVDSFPLAVPFSAPASSLLSDSLASVFLESALVLSF